MLISPLPPRNYLPPDSTYTRLYRADKRFFSELCLHREEVRMTDLSGLRKHHFTAHGLHLNGMGKRLLASALVKELARPSSSPSRLYSVVPPASMYLERLSLMGLPARTLLPQADELV
ncbi:hypothetical protein J6590_067312 [Homalodisca vitripennis]|nr:hypothetical protein J6590_067312 [Homalodisca vitripennis]